MTNQLTLGETGQGEDLPRFHPVRLVERRDLPRLAPEPNTVGIEIVVSDGRRLVVRRGFDPALLIEVVRALEGP